MDSMDPTNNFKVNGLTVTSHSYWTSFRIIGLDSLLATGEGRERRQARRADQQFGHRSSAEPMIL